MRLKRGYRLFRGGVIEREKKMEAARVIDAPHVICAKWCFVVVGRLFRGYAVSSYRDILEGLQDLAAIKNEKRTLGGTL